MFDDYDYKNKEKRISIQFVQQRDEPMYPWEIGGFLDSINTIYYKFDLLNSISSALKEGVEPSDIFIFDKSLPLYKRYAEMNVLEESAAASHFYSIGHPYPLFPSKDIYEYNLLYRAFYTINSFLLKNKVRPLAIKNIAKAYNEMRTNGLDKAELFIIDLAEERAKKSFELSKRKKELVTRDQIFNCLVKYRKRKAKQLEDLINIGEFNNEKCQEILESDKRSDREISNTLLAFFRYFEKISRPLVCARVAKGKFRVLGRSLINKRERNGLELKEASKKSPFKAAFDCGITMVQALSGETRSNQLHELDLEKKRIEIEVVKEQLVGEKLKNLKLAVEIQRDYENAAKASDINAIKHVQSTYIKKEIFKAYGQQERHAAAMLDNKGIYPDATSIKFIDVKA